MEDIKQRKYFIADEGPMIFVGDYVRVNTTNEHYYIGTMVDTGEDYNLASDWILVQDESTAPVLLYDYEIRSIELTKRAERPTNNTNYESDDKMVSHPPHYQSETGLEVIDVIEAFTFDLKGIEATDTGNILKYICRWRSKNGKQDLKKAMWYLTHLINHVEKLEKEND